MGVRSPMLGRSEKFRSWIPQGFDYLSTATTERLLELKGKLREVHREAGYEEITPPTFDYSRTFRLTTRDSAGRLLFETRDVDGEHLIVRSDLTVQVVKAAANGRFGQQYPLRLAYIQPVFQDRPWGSGRAREVIQAGVEEIGTADTDQSRVERLLGLARECVQALGQEVRFIYGDARLLERLLEGLPAGLRGDISSAFFNKDSARLRQLGRDARLDRARTTLLAEIPLTFGGREALERLEDLCAEDPYLLGILREAEGHEDVIYDFSMVRELSYYTGPVFEAYGAVETEPLLSGGVYDGLHGEFGDRETDACGFALNLSLLL